MTSWTHHIDVSSDSPTETGEKCAGNYGNSRGEMPRPRCDVLGNNMFSEKILSGLPTVAVVALVKTWR